MRGERPQAVMTSMGKSLFWKDKPLVEKMLGLWDSAGLARVSERAGALERQLMSGDVAASGKRWARNWSRSPASAPSRPLT